MFDGEKRVVGRRTIKRKSGRQMVDGNGRLLDEISCIEEEAAAHDVRMATIGQLILFSTDTGRCLAARRHR